MANILYPKFKEALLAGDVDLADGPVSAILVDLAEYAFSEAHDALNDVPANARLSAPQLLDGKSITDGVFRANDATFPSVPAGGEAGAILIYLAGGSDAASRLVAFLDDVDGLPVLTNGGTLVAEWNPDAILYL